MSDFEPKVIVFCCNWGACTNSDLTDMFNRPHSKIIRTMCSGRIEPTYILQAFNKGVDGVMIAGCNPGDCHYQSGNLKAKRRLMLLQNMLTQFGIEADRLRLEWASASESPKFQLALKEFIDEITELGPLALGEKVIAY